MIQLANGIFHPSILLLYLVSLTQYLREIKIFPIIMWHKKCSLIYLVSLTHYLWEIKMSIMRQGPQRVHGPLTFCKKVFLIAGLSFINEYFLANLEPPKYKNSPSLILYFYESQIMY